LFLSEIFIVFADSKKEEFINAGINCFILLSNIRIMSFVVIYYVNIWKCVFCFFSISLVSSCNMPSFTFQYVTFQNVKEHVLESKEVLINM